MCVYIFLDTFVYMYLSVSLHHSYLIVSTFWLSYKVSMRSIFCSLFFKRFFFIIVFCFAIASANSMEIHAVKMPQKMPNKTPKIAQLSLISTVSSCSFRTFFPTKQAVCVFVLVFYSEIFLRCCRSWTKLQIGLKAYKLYAKSAASLGKCSAALSAH